MLILNGVVHPMDGPVIPRGFVAFEGEKLTAVGPMAVSYTHLTLPTIRLV